MIAFDTTKKYVLLRCIETGGRLMEEKPIIFGDTKEELEYYCKVIDCELIDDFFDHYKQCMILPTTEYVDRMDNYVYKGITEYTLTHQNDSIEQKCQNYIDVSDLNVGDEFSIYHRTLKWRIPFIVIGKNHDVEDSVTILSKLIIDTLPFDAMEPENPDYYRQRYGNNRYKHSNLLNWLNDDSINGPWHLPSPHKYDHIPDKDHVKDSKGYEDYSGFLSGFPKNFKKQLVFTDKRTDMSGTDGDGTSECVSSRVFLLSATEVGLNLFNDTYMHDNTYEYFSKNNTDTNRIARELNLAGAADVDWWLRTPNKSNSYDVHTVSSSGKLSSSSARTGCVGVRPAMVIKNYE